MDELDELKELMDIAEAKALGCENAWRKANEEFAKAKQAYEKERDKDKKCESCMYNIVLDFSEDGWHNLCGNAQAPCTCCYTRCEHYKPDTYLTSAIKNFFHNERKREPNLEPEFIEGLQNIGFRIYDDDMSETYEKDMARRLVEVLKVTR